MGLTEIRERRKELIEAAEQMEEKFFQDQINGLREACAKSEGINEQAGKEFRLLCRSWPKERKAASLGCCYRRTDALMRRNGYWLIFYGEEFYLDEEPVKQWWKPPGFAERYETDMARIISGLKKEFPRLRPYEEETVRQRVLEYYHGAVYVLFKEKIEELIHTQEFQTLPRTEDFFVFFGHDRGEGEVLLSWKKRKKGGKRS